MHNERCVLPRISHVRQGKAYGLIMPFLPNARNAIKYSVHCAFTVSSLCVHCAFTARSLCLELGAHMGCFGQCRSKGPSLLAFSTCSISPSIRLPALLRHVLTPLGPHHAMPEDGPKMTARWPQKTPTIALTLTLVLPLLVAFAR